jgi:hypothetical protein
MKGKLEVLVWLMVLPVRVLIYSRAIAAEINGPDRDAAR